MIEFLHNNNNIPHEMVNYYLDLCKKHNIHNNVIMLYTLELQDYVNPIKYLVTIPNDKRVFFYLGLIL